jgi:hypothetical protein
MGYTDNAFIPSLPKESAGKFGGRAYQLHHSQLTIKRAA